MTDQKPPLGPDEPGEGKPSEFDSISITDEMRRSYLDYAMSVIVSRALPDVRDGLKPVHRRILHAMNEAGFEWNRPYRKSARVVGDLRMEPGEGLQNHLDRLAVLDRLRRRLDRSVDVAAAQALDFGLAGARALAVKFTNS